MPYNLMGSCRVLVNVSVIFNHCLSEYSPLTLEFGDSKPSHMVLLSHLLSRHYSSGREREEKNHA